MSSQRVARELKGNRTRAPPPNLPLSETWGRLLESRRAAQIRRRGLCTECRDKSDPISAALTFVWKCVRHAALSGSSGWCCRGRSCIYTGVYSRWRLIINAGERRGCIAVELQLPELRLYQQSTGASKRPSEPRASCRRLITAEMFCWELQILFGNAGKCGAYILSAARTKRPSASAAYGVRVTQFTSK